MKPGVNLLLAFSDMSPPTRLAVGQFCVNVAKRTNNLVAISAVPDKQLGQPMTLLKSLMQGKLDMLIQPVDRWGGTLPKFGCVPAPFAFDNHAHADRVFDGGFNDWISQDLECCGLSNLSSWEWGFRQITNSRWPLLKPEDMRGLKIRVPPASIHRSVIVALGALPVVVEFEKLAKVLRQRLVDGQENPVAVYYSLELQSTQKYISLLNYSYVSFGHLMNNICFDKLTPEQILILGEESRKAGQFTARLLRAQENQRLLAIEGQGIQVDRPDPSPFKALMSSVHDGIEESFGADNLSSFLAMLAHWREPADQENI